MRWWSAARVFGRRQTGNSGANPGRPRRCDRARSAKAFSDWPLFASASEKARFRGRSGVRRPTNAWHADRCEGQRPRAVCSSRIAAPWRAPCQCGMRVRQAASGQSDMQLRTSRSRRVHPRRAAGRRGDHRRAGGAVAPGGAGRPRIVAPQPVPEQSAPAGHRHGAPRQRHGDVSDRLHRPRLPRRGRVHLLERAAAAVLGTDGRLGSVRLFAAVLPRDNKTVGGRRRLRCFSARAPTIRTCYSPRGPVERRGVHRLRRHLRRRRPWP